MNRPATYNFSAGPAMLPPAVIERLRADLPDYHGLGLSVMELSHRSPPFDEVAERSEAAFRRLLGLDDDWAVLFLAGGATQQFSVVPMNLATPDRPGAYVLSGHWGRKALRAAERLGRGVLLASSEAEGFIEVPARERWRAPRALSYVHVTSNETLAGVQCHDWPEPPAPLVADMSSDLLARVFDPGPYLAFYASAQKNLGQAGITVVAVRREALHDDLPGVPELFHYALQARQGSRLNTPPSFAWYVAGLVFDWVEGEGGVPEMQRRAEARSGRLYSVIDASGLYRNRVPPRFRSTMNVHFDLDVPDLEPRFLEAAAEEGFVGLRGHRELGGIRASLYNAMPRAGAEALAAFMVEFERRHG